MRFADMVPMLAVTAASALGCSRPIGERIRGPESVSVARDVRSGGAVALGYYEGDRLVIAVLSDESVTEQRLTQKTVETLHRDYPSPKPFAPITEVVDFLVGAITLGVVNTTVCYQHPPDWDAPSGVGFALRSWASFLNPLDQCAYDNQTVGWTGSKDFRIERSVTSREPSGSPVVYARRSPKAGSEVSVTVSGRKQSAKTNALGLAEFPVEGSPAAVDAVVAVPTVGLQRSMSFQRGAEPRVLASR